MIGKSVEEIEKEKGFVWYVEFKPEKMFGIDLDEHNRLMKVFVEFLPLENIKILEAQMKMILKRVNEIEAGYKN